MTPEQERLQSTDVFLAAAILEYQMDGDRFRSADERSGIMMAAVVALLGLFLPQLQVGLFTTATQDAGQWLLFVLQFIALAFLLIFACAAIISLARALSMRKYEALDARALADFENHLKEKEQSEFALTERLCGIIDKNRETTDAKLALVQQGIDHVVRTGIAAILYALLGAVA